VAKKNGKSRRQSALVNSYRKGDRVVVPSLALVGTIEAILDDGELGVRLDPDPEDRRPSYRFMRVDAVQVDRLVLH
jgi:hypothetical protein